MKVSLRAQHVRGSLQVPPSKSHTQRVYAAALLHKGETFIKSWGSSNDEMAALAIIRSLGAQVEERSSDLLLVRSSGILSPDAQVHCGESGLAARLFMPILGLSQKPIELRGEGSLLSRPMDAFLPTLKGLGMHIQAKNAYLPFKVSGPLLIPDNVEVREAGNSSQWITGLLFALAYGAPKKISIQVQGLVSKPYIDLTMAVLQHFGRPVQQEDYGRFFIDPAQFHYTEKIEVDIEADWSAAAFWIVAAGMNGNMQLSGLNPESTQADKQVLSILQSAGVLCTWNGPHLSISRPELLQPFEADLNDCPDLFPVLAVMAAAIEGKSTLSGTQRLVHKESDRLKSIMELLLLLAVPFELSDNALHISGVSRFPAFHYDSPNDHRMAMAAALAALRTGDVASIDNAACVAKSYPNFWEHIQAHYSA